MEAETLSDPSPSAIPGAAALATFCGQDDAQQEFTDELRLILQVTAWTGNYWHEWPLLKCLLSFRLNQILNEYRQSEIVSGIVRETLATGETFEQLVKRLDEGLDLFEDGPPFTLQRLCEVMLNPQSTYPTVDKLALALEKLLLVTSTIPLCKDPYPSFPVISSNENKTAFQHQQNFEANGFPQEMSLSDQAMMNIGSVDDLQVLVNDIKRSEDEQSAGNGNNEGSLMKEDLEEIELGDDDQKTPTDS